jgi:hypothetical protein
MKRGIVVSCLLVLISIAGCVTPRIELDHVSSSRIPIDAEFVQDCNAQFLHFRAR